MSGKLTDGTGTNFLLRILEGAIIGLGAVLPGVSGGVLCVVFGVYKPMMELMSEPFRSVKRHYQTLIPLLIGLAVGFMGISRVLGKLLESYPDQSMCLFVGLIVGMLPSLFRQAGEKGREKGSFGVMFGAFAVILVLLLVLERLSADIRPNFGWYIFCGVCLVLSIIVPGLSFSTLLMPLGLYVPFVAGVGSLDLAVVAPAFLGALATLLLLARAINRFFEEHYSHAYHGIIGIVIAATLVIVPFESFVSGGDKFLSNTICLILGAAAAFLVDRFNRSVSLS